MQAKLALTKEWRLFVGSFLLLFAEVMAIRWLAAELPLVRSMPNMVLMIIFVGAASGMGKSERPLAPAWSLCVALLALVVPLILAVNLGMEGLSLRVGPGEPWTNVAAAIALICLLAGGLIFLFMNLGVVIGRLFSELAPLRAYSMNLLGSAFGVLVFGLSGLCGAPPAVWLLFCGIAVWLLSQRSWVLILSVIIAGISFASSPADHWSPYSKIQLSAVPVPPGSVLGSGNYFMNANNRFLQFALRIIPPALDSQLAAEAKHEPKLASLYSYTQMFSVPYSHAPSHDNVLILGAGCGNDVAYALRAGAKHVDAVEIDPVIAAYGKTLHPNRPYNDPRVHVYTEDARTFLRYGNAKYDLIEFAFLDFARAYNAASFLRVDNFIHTVEAYKSAVSHLNPQGIVALSFATGRDSIITHRLFKSIKEATGVKPVVLANDQDTFLLFGPGIVGKTITDTSGLNLQALSPQQEMADERPATDDWPFLYLDYRSIGLALYIVVLAVSVLLPAILLTTVKTEKSAITGLEWGNMFFLGQAFMLLETMSITRLSLIFGATWMVSSVVIFTVLLLVWCANWCVQTGRVLKTPVVFTLLLASVLVSYLFRVPIHTDLHPALIACAATTITCLPVFFSGLVFSTCFKSSKNPAQYLAANLLGAAVGGLTENFAMWTGLQSLVLVALLLYGLAIACWWQSNRAKAVGAIGAEPVGSLPT